MFDVDPTTLSAYGLPGLFVLAFLAASILPLPSEALMIALLLGGTHPVITVVVAFAGNMLGAVTLYWIGKRLVHARRGKIERWLARVAKIDVQRLERAMLRLQRSGPPALLLSWMPVLGDLLVLASGSVGVRPVPFAVFTGIGKAARFVVVAVATLAAAGAAG